MSDEQLPERRPGDVWMVDGKTFTLTKWSDGWDCPYQGWQCEPAMPGAEPAWVGEGCFVPGRAMLVSRASTRPITEEGIRVYDAAAAAERHHQRRSDLPQIVDEEEDDLSSRDAVAGLREVIDSAAREQLGLIAANRERYIQAWIAETGLLPSEAELVEKRGLDGTVTVQVRKRSA